MTQRDLQPAQAALSRMRAGDATVVAFRDSLVGAARTATIVPVRWRSRAPLAQYVEAADHLDRAMRNARVLARRTVALLRDGEDLPEPVPAAVGSLADAVDALRQELAAGHEPRRCPQLCVQAMRQAAEGYRAGVQLSGGVVVGQVRSAAADLLRACGLSPEQAQRAARRVTGGAIQAAALGFGP